MISEQMPGMPCIPSICILSNLVTNVSSIKMSQSSVVYEHDAIGPNDPPRYFPDRSADAHTPRDHQQQDLPQETDWTARLPDELLVAIMDCLPSLRAKLQLESVSHKFQRCLIKLFNIKPLPFELEMIGEWEQMSDAVQMLEHKTKFCSLVYGGNRHSTLDPVFSLLIDTNTQCQDNMTSFQSNAVGSHALLQQVLAKCGELSSLKLILPVQHGLDLGPALNNKALTQLTLKLKRFSQVQLVGLLQSIRPNMLKRMRLECVSMLLVDSGPLVRDLGVGAWAALEEIEFDFGQEAIVRWANLFASLGRLPQLHKCCIELYLIEPDQFVSALTSLFSSQIEMVVSATSWNRMSLQLPYCQFVNMIRQVQALHPMLGIEFYISSGRVLKLSLGRVSFEGCFDPRPCNENCINCGSFYPILISNMRWLAHERVDAHLQVGRLDRCKTDRVVHDLNYYADCCSSFCRALAVETDANLATITFESETKTHQFKITVVCGSCLSRSCIKCVPID